MLKELIKIPSFMWGKYAFSREILKDKISEEEKNRLTIKANECGYSYADQLIGKYGATVPSKIAKALGLDISYPEVPTDLSRVLFAERLTGIAYSPFVMDVFFVYGYNKEVAVNLYDEIMELANESLLIK